MHNANFQEAHRNFFHQVHQVIFQDHEFRTIQSLLSDYKRIISNFGYNSIVKSSYLKAILTKEFGDSIGFQERHQKNMSELVYDTTAGGTYVEAAMSSLGISDEQLLMNVARRLKEHILESPTMAWVPYIHELERKEEPNELLMKLVSWMKTPKILLRSTPLEILYILSGPTSQS